MKKTKIFFVVEYHAPDFKEWFVSENCRPGTGDHKTQAAAEQALHQRGAPARRYRVVRVKQTASVRTVVTKPTQPNR